MKAIRKESNNDVYITEQNRNECSDIFATRTRILGVKNNYRTAHDDLVFRWCKADQETQYHITKECPNFQCHTENLDISKIINPQRKITKLMQSSSMTSIRKSMIDVTRSDRFLNIFKTVIL